MTTANVSAVTAASSSSTDTAPAAVTAAIKPEPCVLCGLVGKHADAPAGTTCVICGKVHGETVKRQIPRGNKGKMALVDRKIAVRHSLLALRAGGLKENGDFVNPAAPWESQPICDDCAHEMGRAVSAARKELFQAGAKRHEVDAQLQYPRIVALPLVVKWVDDENAKEAAQKERLAQKRAANEVALADDKKRREIIKLLVLKGARPHRSGNERRGSVPAVPATVADRIDKNGGRRNDRGNGKRVGHVAEVEGASEAEVQEQLDAQAKGRGGALPLAAQTARA